MHRAHRVVGDPPAAGPLPAPQEVVDEFAGSDAVITTPEGRGPDDAPPKTPAVVCDARPPRAGAGAAAQQLQQAPCERFGDEEVAAAAYRPDWAGEKVAALAIYGQHLRDPTSTVMAGTVLRGPAHAATHWVAEAIVGDGGLRIRASVGRRARFRAVPNVARFEATAAAFRCTVGAAPPDPGQFARYSVSWDVGGGLLGAQLFARYICNTFAKELVSTFVRRDDPEDDFM
eukprot:gene47636-32577_t